MILFTKKEKVTVPFKSVSAEFRNKVRFYIVYVPEKNPPSDLVALSEQYSAQDLPKLLIEQTFDTEQSSQLPDKKTIVYEGKSYKFRDLEQFIRPFAREVAKEESEEMEK